MFRSQSTLRNKHPPNGTVEPLSNENPFHSLLNTLCEAVTVTVTMSTAAILFLRRLPRLRSSLPLTNLHFVAVDYLIQSYGLPSNEALRASKRIQHLKSPDKPDAVLRFLRQIGISESDIRTAVSREPRLLVSGLEKNLRPNVAKLQEIVLSIEDISGIIYHCPLMFLFNIVQKIDLWMWALGSLENMSVLLKRAPNTLH